MTLFYNEGLSLKSVRPQLWQSLRQIHAYNTEWKTLKGQIFSNFAISCAGSIRKASNVSSWCHALTCMKNAGENDKEMTIQAWNSRAISSQKLQGGKWGLLWVPFHPPSGSPFFVLPAGKYTAVKMLVDNASEDILELIQTCVSMHGWENCPWSDDTFACKKIWPGVHWRTTQSKPWTERMQITRDSAKLMFEHILWGHEHGAGDISRIFQRALGGSGGFRVHNSRKPKFTEPSIEDKACSAAVCCNLGKEAVAAGVPMEQ
eukprot:4941895-Amphidinium_carterae.1